MLWGMFGYQRQRAIGRRYRAEHSAWLTDALAGRRRFVRIPTRPLSEGGFGPMTSRRQALAQRWWSRAFDHTH